MIHPNRITTMATDRDCAVNKRVAMTLALQAAAGAMAGLSVGPGWHVVDCDSVVTHLMRDTARQSVVAMRCCAFKLISGLNAMSVLLTF